jgi:hypothetical protein
VPPDSHLVTVPEFLKAVLPAPPSAGTSTQSSTPAVAEGEAQPEK